MVRVVPHMTIVGLAGVFILILSSRPTVSAESKTLHMQMEKILYVRNPQL